MSDQDKPACEIPLFPYADGSGAKFKVRGIVHNGDIFVEIVSGSECITIADDEWPTVDEAVKTAIDFIEKARTV